MLLRGFGLGDDFERDNFDYVQAAVAAIPPAQLVTAPASWLATPAGHMTPAQIALDVATTVPPRQPGSWIRGIAAVVAAPLAPPAPTSVPAAAAPPVDGPNVTALRAEMQAAGIASEEQAQAWLTSLDGAPFAGLTEDSAARYLAALDIKRQHAKWTKWGIAGAAGVGLLLLLRR